MLLNKKTSDFVDFLCQTYNVFCTWGVGLVEYYLTELVSLAGQNSIFRMTPFPIKNLYFFRHLTPLPDSSSRLYWGAGIAGWGQNTRSVTEGSAKGDGKEKNRRAFLVDWETVSRLGTSQLLY